MDIQDTLSRPIFAFTSKYLLNISLYLQEKIKKNEFKKFTNTICCLKNKINDFMELYERAKIKEGQIENKKNKKTAQFAYKPWLPDQ